jgi:hypothetical protein
MPCLAGISAGLSGFVQSVIGTSEKSISLRAEGEYCQ